MAGSITTKRIYLPTARTDGARILVDRLWPRGVRREDAFIDFWAKEVSPSTELRKWYQHDHKKWPSFRKKYWAELDTHAPDKFDRITELLNSGDITLVFSSKEENLNNARALKEYLEEKLYRELQSNPSQ